MAKRGPKAKQRNDAAGVAGLHSRNIVIANHRTSMRLEPSMWSALDDIAARENMSVNDLCTRIKDRIDEQARQRGIDPDKSDVTLTSAVRVFIAAYYRRAATEDGHSRVGHGVGEPFAGTPFEAAPGSDDSSGGDDGLPPGDEGPGFSGTGTGGGMRSMAADTARMEA